MRKHILWIVILTSLVYINALYGNFVYDDYLVIVDNGFIKSAKNIALLFSRRYLTHPLEAGFNVGAYNIGSGEGSYRPVATLSYFLNYAVFKLDPFGYRLTNIVIHILCAILIYMLLNILFAKPRFALFTAILFGIHPVNAEVINCTAFRPNSLALLLCLLAINLYFKFKEASGRAKYFYITASLFSALLAMFSKEIAVILPLAIVLCDYYHFHFDSVKVLKNLKVYLLYFLIVAIYIAIYFLMMPPTQTIFNVQDIYVNLMRMFDTLGIYVKDIVYPVDLVFIDSMAIFQSHFNVVLGIATSIISIYIVVKKNKFNPEVSFGVIWFFLWLLPMNNFLNMFRILAAYRYLYPPIVGFAVLAGFILTKIWEANTRTPILQRTVPLACFAYFAIFSISSNATWKNDMILNLSMVEKNPTSFYAHMELGNTLLKYGNLTDAKDELNFALSRPDLDKYNPAVVSVVYSNLGYIYLTENEYAKAEQIYQQALSLTPHLAYLHTQLGICYVKQGLYEKAFDYFNKAKKINPYYTPAYVRAGRAYMLLRKYAQAKIEFNKALQIYSDYEPARDGLKELEKVQKEAGK